MPHLPAVGLLLLMALAGPASAQFQVEQKADFESGALPAQAVTFGNNRETCIAVTPLDPIAAGRPGFRAPTAADETGRYGLMLRADPRSADVMDYVVGMGLDLTAERDRLGNSMQLVCQADVYFPPTGEPIPAIGLMATEPLLPPPSGLPVMVRDFYRFGCNEEGFYFSCVSKRAPKAATYKTDAALFSQLARPGWHRLSMVFTGTDTIRCFVDGLEASFSPVHHGLLRKVQTGVTLTEKAARYDAYVDNVRGCLSGLDESYLMSPYGGPGMGRPGAGPGPGGGAGAGAGRSGAARPGTALPGAVPQPAAPVSSLPQWPSAAPPAATAAAGAGAANWQSAVDAWKKAQGERKPLLLFFYSAGQPTSEKLYRIFESEPAARAFLAGHACSRVDTSQPAGEAIARKYQVNRLPAVLIISPQATESARADFRADDTWPTFQARLHAAPR